MLFSLSQLMVGPLQDSYWVDNLNVIAKGGSMREIKRVLIIEDCQDDFEVYSRLLKRMNITNLTHYNSAEKAYETLKNQHEQFDVVLLDYNLPGMSGISFLKKLKQIGSEIDAPVIVLTGQGDEKIAVNFMQLNASDYLQKDGLDQDKLANAINKACQNYNKKKQEQEQQRELLLFAHTLAHDLKNPIARIKAYCSLIKKKPDNGQKYFNLIWGDAVFLMEFIDKLLQYAEYGRSIDAMQEVELSKVIKKAMELLEVAIKDKNATITIEGNLPKIYGSELALVQLFQNLFSNSIKYCNKTPKIIVRSSVEADRITISVIDNGDGIPKEMREKIFQPFYRLANRTDVEGSGLGLAIVKSIINQHNAEIELVPLGNEGTQFDIRFAG